jgi:cathepsin D
VTASFGGTAWPISDEDINLGLVDQDQCLGAIMTSDVAGHGDAVDRYPTWILGDVFMVQHSILLPMVPLLISASHPVEKCIFCLQGGSFIGFAALSDAANSCKLPCQAWHYPSPNSLSGAPVSTSLQGQGSSDGMSTAGTGTGSGTENSDPSITPSASSKKNDALSRKNTSAMSAMLMLSGLAVTMSVPL